MAFFSHQVSYSVPLKGRYALMGFKVGVDLGYGQVTAPPYSAWEDLRYPASV